MEKSALNKVYLNGKLIGEVELTGDHEKDKLLARQFLQDKGLHKETTRVQAMFRQALSFATTAAYLYEKDLCVAPRNGLSVAPFVVNIAFAIEVYLKTLAQIHGASLTGHELLKLYDSLPPEALAALEAAMPKTLDGRPVTGNLSLRECLERLNNAFVNWRYVYEKGTATAVTLQETIAVGRALHTACVASGQT